MLDQVISTLAAWIVAVISAGGYFGVVILMAIESACIPLPSEIIMPFAGYLVSIGRFSLTGAATAGALGCNVGSTVAYYVAAKGGRPAFERWGRYVLISAAELDRAEHFFARYGAITVLMPSLRCCWRQGWCGLSGPDGANAVARITRKANQAATFLINFKAVTR